MFMRVDKLQASLPAPNVAGPNAAALLELLDGKYGEMSTLGNYAPGEMFEIAEKLYKACRNRHRGPQRPPMFPLCLRRQNRSSYLRHLRLTRSDLFGDEMGRQRVRKRVFRHRLFCYGSFRKPLWYPGRRP